MNDTALNPGRLTLFLLVVKSFYRGKKAHVLYNFLSNYYRLILKLLAWMCISRPLLLFSPTYRLSLVLFSHFDFPGPWTTIIFDNDTLVLHEKAKLGIFYT